MIDIFQTWVDRGVDGFRIDTMKHVNVEFWQQWAPAIEQYAKQKTGNEDFFMFGEVFSANPELLSMFTTKGQVQSVLDFGFQNSATNFAARNANAKAMADFFATTTTTSTPTATPTACRRSSATTTWAGSAPSSPRATRRQRRGAAGARPARARAHVLLPRHAGRLLRRRAGLHGTGGDKAARQDLDPSQTPIYLDDDQIGSAETPADDNFDTDHPMYRTLTELAAVTRQHAALRSGAQLPRYAATARACWPSAGSTATSGSSTWSSPTTPRRRASRRRSPSARPGRRSPRCGRPARPPR
jgi:glycosidase